MNNKVLVRTEELKVITNNIIQEKNDILDLYTESLVNILTTSEIKLTNYSKEVNEVSKELKKLFSELDTNVTDLTNVLLNKIIPNYENLSTEIKALFDNNFADKLTQLLETDTK